MYTITVFAYRVIILDKTAFKSPPTKMLHFEQIHLFSKLLLWSCHTCFLNQNLMRILKKLSKIQNILPKLVWPFFVFFSYISYVISCFPSKNHIFYNRNLIFSMLSWKDICARFKQKQRPGCTQSKAEACNLLRH